LLREGHGDGWCFEFQRIGNYLRHVNRHASAQAAGKSAGRVQSLGGAGKAGVDHIDFELGTENFWRGDRRCYANC